MGSDDKKEETPLDQLEQVKETVEKFIKPIAAVISAVLPILIKYGSVLWNFWKKLPKDEAKMVIGLAFCFFGGLYPLLFAAFQAARSSGWDSMIEAISVLTNEMTIILEEDKKDNQKDEDGDGIPDVDEISNKEFVLRKTKLIVTKVNPKKVDDAIGTLYKVWLGVAAALMVKFARTISLSLALADGLNKPVQKYLAPLLAKIVPKEYSKWPSVLTGWMVKSIAMSIAWYIQAVISALASALQGGLIVGRAALSWCLKKDLNPFGLIPKDDKDTYIDEVIGYGLAALGFGFQFYVGFDITFPFNIPLLPFETAEFWLRWYVST